MFDGEKEDRGPTGDIGIEGNSGSDGKFEWSEMAQTCVEEGWWACFEKSIGVWSEGQEEARTTKEDMEDASGEGEQECWFGEGGCHKSSKMGELELERLLLEWGKSGHPGLWGYTRIKIGCWWIGCAPYK